MKPNKNKESLNNNEHENGNMKRFYDQTFLNSDHEDLNIKKNRTSNYISNNKYNNNEILSNNHKAQNLENILMQNSNEDLLNIQDFIEEDENNNNISNNENEENNVNNDDYNNSNYCYYNNENFDKNDNNFEENNNDNSDNDDDDYYSDDESNNNTNTNNNNNNNINNSIEEIIDYKDLKNYIDNFVYENNDNKSSHSDELLDNVWNPFDNSKPSNSIEQYFNLKDNKFSEMESMQENPMNMLNKCLLIANTTTKKVKKMMQTLNNKNMIFNFLLAWCFYEIGIIYMIFYVDEGENEYLENAIYYRNLLIEASKSYLSVSPYLSKYNEMLQEAEDSVKNNTKRLVIKDFF